MKTNIQTLIKIIAAAMILSTTSCALNRELTTAKEQKVYLQKVYTELMHEISNEAEVKIVEDSVKVIFVSGVLFNVSEAVIRSELQSCFNRFANVLNKYLNTTILVAGHTDSTGDVKSNIELSQKRADSAKDLLLKFAVSEKRIYTLGHGAAIPVDDNNTVEGRAKNRRVEFIILYSYNREKK